MAGMNDGKYGYGFNEDDYQCYLKDSDNLKDRRLRGSVQSFADAMTEGSITDDPAVLAVILSC